MSDIFDLATDRDAAAAAVQQDPNLRIFQFNGVYRHDVDLRTLSSQLERISVIDQYAGSIPEIFSLRRHIALRSEITVHRTLLLDSNVARYLRSFLRGGLNEPLMMEIRLLLKWIAAQNLNVHPGFSLMETISGSDDPNFHGPELVKLALLVSGMDSQLFIDTGRVELGAAGKEFVSRTYGTTDLDEAAALEFHRLPKATHKVVDVTYAALLKIAIIDASHLSFEQKIDAFIDFLESDLGVILSVEIAVAILFFAGKVRRFIPLISASPMNEKLQRVRSSAWDIFLARMAAAFIGESDEQTLTLPLIATGDGLLKVILRTQELRGVIKDQGKPPNPVVATDFEYLESVCPGQWDSTHLQRRVEKIRTTPGRRQGDLPAIIATLEAEVVRIFAARKR